MRFVWPTTIGSTIPGSIACPRKKLASLMQGLKDRMDYLTITGSLNEELSDKHY
ncbi:Fe-only/vanadium nitrogenase subunit delta [Azorhizophilus paspali]|uniref:Fe-only/vanadium nitrogenase subunit delta n=1 Tax=Azorhizophilus paspali TaxID=69963 RepID=UPI00363E2665